MTSFCIRHDSLFQSRICSSGFNFLVAFAIVLSLECYTNSLCYKDIMMLFISPSFFL